MLNPGTGRTKTGQLWACARDDRPWGGGDPPMVAYVYAADRKSERAEAHLGDFAGILQVDGYGGYAALAKRRQQLQLAFCWSHVRRKFYELADKSPVATEVLRRIAQPYVIEGEIRGMPAAQRRGVRSERSRVIVDDLRQYLDARNRQVSAKSKLAEAMRYALTRWEGLSRFLEDGRVDLDSNTVERSIRPLALNRKNALFAGSDEGGDNWAIIATLIENCKLSGINPRTWMTETLAKLAAGHPANAVDKLMPWTYVAREHRLRGTLPTSVGYWNTAKSATPANRSSGSPAAQRLIPVRKVKETRLSRHHRLRSSAAAANQVNPPSARVFRTLQSLRASVIQALGDAFLAAQLGDTVLAAQPIEHDTDLVLGRDMATGLPADVLDHPFSRGLHRRSFQGGLGLHPRSFVTTTKPQPSLIHNLRTVPWVLTADRAAWTSL